VTLHFARQTCCGTNAIDFFFYSELSSNRYILEYSKFVQYVAVLDDSWWPKRALAWNAGVGTAGRSFDVWDAVGTKFYRRQTSGEWQVAAQALVVVVPAGFCHVYAHPLCPKRAAAPLHTGAKTCR